MPLLAALCFSFSAATTRKQKPFARPKWLLVRAQSRFAVTSRSKISHIYSRVRDAPVLPSVLSYSGKYTLTLRGMKLTNLGKDTCEGKG